MKRDLCARMLRTVICSTSKNSTLSQSWMFPPPSFLHQRCPPCQGAYRRGWVTRPDPFAAGCQPAQIPGGGCATLWEHPGWSLPGNYTPWPRPRQPGGKMRGCCHFKVVHSFCWQLWSPRCVKSLHWCFPGWEKLTGNRTSMKFWKDLSWKGEPH